MSKLQILITVILITVFGGLFFFIQQQNSATQGTGVSVTPSIPALLDDTETYQDVNLTPRQGQQLSPTQGAPKQLLGPINASVSAMIKTSKGDIKVMLFGAQAEQTVRNFMEKANSGYYKNLTFHRVEDWVVQGGDPRGDGTGGGMIATEPNQLPFVTGSLGVARGGNPQISNDSQFFITKTDATHLNGQYTNFGIVTNGMSIVSKLKVGDKILGITIEE